MKLQYRTWARVNLCCTRVCSGRVASIERMWCLSGARVHALATWNWVLVALLEKKRSWCECKLRDVYGAFIVGYGALPHFVLMSMMLVWSWLWVVYDRCSGADGESFHFNALSQHVWDATMIGLTKHLPSFCWSCYVMTGAALTEKIGICDFSARVCSCVCVCVRVVGACGSCLRVCVCASVRIYWSVCT